MNSNSPLKEKEGSSLRKNMHFDYNLKQNEELLNESKQNSARKDGYSTLNISNLDGGVTLSENKTFIRLKSELQAFNDEMNRAIAEKKTISNYVWKKALYTGLKNLLSVVVSTDDRILKDSFMNKANVWFYDKLHKKMMNSTSRSVSRSGTRNSTTFVTDSTRLLSDTMNKQLEQDSGFLNISAVRPDSQNTFLKKLLPEEISDTSPSKYRASILRDYEEGHRTKNFSAEPPYER